MTDSATIQTELWRLGLLLTGTDAGATAALSRVLRAHDDPRKIAQDRRRRLLIMGSREWLQRNAAADSADDSPAGRASRLASSLESLPREVWALREVLQWSDVETAHALGIARSAEAAYLDKAAAMLRSALADEYTPAVAALRARWSTVDAAAGIDAARAGLRAIRIRRRLISAAQLLLLLALLSIFSWIGADLLRASRRERANSALQETLSNPMPRDEALKQRPEAPAGRSSGSNP